MEIFVDADACPVIKIIERTAKEYLIPVTLLCDTNENIGQSFRKLIEKAGGNNIWE